MLARDLMLLKRWNSLKNDSKKILLLFVFILLASFPFLYFTELIGLELFFDSFENSDSYICIQDRDNTFKTNSNGDYLIIQKASHPDFNVGENDDIIYYNNEGDISFTKVTKISSISALKRYYIEEPSEYGKSSIFENQILGKIIEIVYDNILNSVSIKIWETSIHNLNLRSLLIN
jgi:hypothetical protein